MYDAIITPGQIRELLQSNQNLLIFDCHHDLNNPEAGREQWRQKRIADAGFLQLDEDLSGPIIPGRTGRHPLPDREKFLSLLKRKGFAPDSERQVIVYDSKFGGIAARAWWMFKWIGHEKVAVLEGGYPAWEEYWKNQQVSDNHGIEVPILTQRKNQAISFEPDKERRNFTDLTTSANADRRSSSELKPEKNTSFENYSQSAVNDIRQDENYTVIDSRTAERYRGEHEPIDPVAGHIEGAINLPWPENLDEKGNFKTIAELKSRFAPLKQQAAQNVFYCGSGVTACHNILAYYHTFGEIPGLYAGSWSEWCIN